MALVINSNIPSLSAQRHLNTAMSGLNSTMERLSSGRRINSAADDAAGLSIATGMTSQIRGMNQAIRNANDGISLLQTADGALDSSQNMLFRMKQLAVQSANETYSHKDRTAMHAEFQMLVAEIDRVNASTMFNGLNTFGEHRSLQVGGNAGDSVAFRLPSLDSQNLGRGSVLGDHISGELQFGAGGLLNGIPANAVEVNGRSLGAIEEGASLAEVKRQLKKDLSGITISSHVEVTASQEGSGVIKDGERFVISGVDKDGNNIEYSFSETRSMSDLASRINNETAGLVAAVIDKDGKLNLSSDSLATLNAADYTTDGASGFGGGITDPTTAFVINGLESSWMAGAEALIAEHYGIKADGRDITLVLGGVDDGAGGVGASVSYQRAGGVNFNIKLNIDMADFANLDDDAAETLIAHEMVHAVMDANDINLNNQAAGGVPLWFSEGTAELIRGVDNRVNAHFSDLLSSGPGGGAGGILPTGTADHGTLSSEQYAASYLAAKMMQDDIYAASGGSEGLDAVMTRLSDGMTMDDALIDIKAKYASLAWSDLATFEAHFNTNADDYMNETYTGGTYTRLGEDLGSIAGSDYGNDPVTSSSLMSPGGGDSEGFNLIVPDHLRGSVVSADARVILDDDSGDEIVARSRVRGGDGNLATLGFNNIQHPGDAGLNGASGTSLSELNLLDSKNAAKAIDVVEFALDSVSDARSMIGAMRNRLEFTIDSLTTSIENTEAARSRILDADYAAEAAHLAKYQVLSQAAQAMLAQANSQPQQVLSLLQ